MSRDVAPAIDEIDFMFHGSALPLPDVLTQETDAALAETYAAAAGYRDALRIALRLVTERQGAFLRLQEQNRKLREELRVTTQAVSA